MSGRLRLEDSAQQSSSCGLLELPLELLNRIFDYCEYEAPFEGVVTMEHYPTNNERNTIKMLRFVDKAFNDLRHPSRVQHRCPLPARRILEQP